MVAEGRPPHRAAMLLGSAGLVEYLLQLLLPVALVRLLPRDDFADYRLTWLMGATACAIFALGIPQSLFYFLPGAEAAKRRRSLWDAGWILAGSALVMLAVAGAAQVGGLWPANVRDLLGHHGAALGVFLVFWLLGSLLDTMPTADGQPQIQARFTLALALLRTVLLGVAAWWFRAAGPVLWMIAALAVAKVLAAAIYVHRRHPGPWQAPWSGAVGPHLRYTLPFAVGTGLFLLRGQIDQWVVASFLSKADYVLVSLGAVMASVSAVVRGPVNNAFMPVFRRHVSDGQPGEAAQSVRQGINLLHTLLLPLLAALMVAVGDLAQLIYTRTYAAAGPVMMVYLLGQMLGLVSCGHLLVATGQGRAQVSTYALSAFIAAAGGVLMVRTLGLFGAPMASSLAYVTGEWISVALVARALGVPWRRLIDLGYVGRHAAAAVGGMAVGLLVRHALADAAMAQRLPAELAAFALAWLLVLLAVGGVRPTLEQLASLRAARARRG